MTFSICSVGDVSFHGRNADHPSINIFLSVVPALKNADMSIANLENPLLDKGDPIQGKCTLRGSVGWAKILKESGFTLLSLANNHMMDYGDTGLFSTLKALENSGLSYVGAGKDIAEAQAPVYLNISGKKIAILARTSVIVSSPSYASKKQPGVAFLDIAETREKICHCCNTADIVILIIHWGLEEYEYPSPHQRKLAKEFVETGVDLVLGHHPHVIQGVEKINNSLINYSSGNFVFDEFIWSFINMDGVLQKNFSKLTNNNRKGCILKVNFYKNKITYNLIPTSINNEGAVLLDNFKARKKDFKRLSSRLKWPGYSFFWKIYAIGREWNLRIKPMIQGKITWEKLRKIQLKHFQDLFHKIKKSAKITSEKSTNPYD